MSQETTMRIRRAAVAVAVLVLAGCGGEPQGTPPAGDGASQEGQPVAEERNDAISVGEGTVTHFADGVQVGAYSTVADTVVQLSVVTPDESIDLELGPGEQADIGGFTVEVVDVTGSAVRVVVTDADGQPLGRG